MGWYVTSKYYIMSLSASGHLCLCLIQMPVLGIRGSKREKLLLQFVSTLGSSLPWATHKPQLSPAAQVADRNPSLFLDLAKSSNCLAPVGAGVSLAPPWECCELKDKPLLMAHTNDLYILIRNAWVKITSWNLNEERKAYLLFLCFSTARKSNKLTWIRSEQISRKLIRNLWFSPSWKYQIFPLQSQENIRLAKGIVHSGLFLSVSIHSHVHTVLTLPYPIPSICKNQKPHG